MGDNFNYNQYLGGNSTLYTEVNHEPFQRNMAMAPEFQHQRDELKSQRDLYETKASNLRKELRLLKDQKDDLTSEYFDASPKTQEFINENEKLQIEIKDKLATIENVVDMLCKIIGEQQIKKRSTSTSSSDSSSTSSSSASSSSSSPDSNSDDESIKLSKSKNIKKKRYFEPDVNYVFFDPEIHWCKTCNIFPKTAKEYLNHLHTEEHLSLNSNSEKPWHDFHKENIFKKSSNNQNKRVPIKGLQFFVPSHAWYCKLCNVWQGDLHCTSQHLKSKAHFINYNKFLEKNPNFEANWLMDRQKELNIINKKNDEIDKNMFLSNDESSKSVRVAMRQVLIDNDKNNLKHVNLQSSPDKSDELVSQWNTIPMTINENDKKLLEQVKSKNKRKDFFTYNSKNDPDVDTFKSNTRRFSRSFSRSPSRNSRRDSKSRYSQEKRTRYYRKYYSRSRSKSDSIESYRSRSREIEKPIVQHFSKEFRPRVEKKDIRKEYFKDERKKSPKKMSDNKSSKKMPFIGKMPVFKKQISKEILSKTNNKELSENIDSFIDKLPMKTTTPTENNEFEDMMPDPQQLASILTASTAICPPGVDEIEVTEVISIDHPILPPPSKRPLHQDFEVALDLIFPSTNGTNANTTDNNIISVTNIGNVSNPENVTKDDDDLASLGLNNEDSIFANF